MKGVSALITVVLLVLLILAFQKPEESNLLKRSQLLFDKLPLSTTTIWLDGDRYIQNGTGDSKRPWKLVDHGSATLLSLTEPGIPNPSPDGKHLLWQGPPVVVSDLVNKSVVKLAAPETHDVSTGWVNATEVMVSGRKGTALTWTTTLLDINSGLAKASYEEATGWRGQKPTESVLYNRMPPTLSYSLLPKASYYDIAVPVMASASGYPTSRSVDPATRRVVWVEVQLGKPNKFEELISHLRGQDLPQPYFAIMKAGTVGSPIARVCGQLKLAEGESVQDVQVIPGGKTCVFSVQRDAWRSVYRIRLP